MTPQTKRSLQSLVRTRRYAAKSRFIPFELTFKDITWPERCPILGILLDYSYGDKGHGGCMNSPSLDRIDPRRGYTLDNYQVISNRANTIKSDAEAYELARVLKAVALEEGRDNQWLKSELGLT